jgi:hypothetical protein
VVLYGRPRAAIAAFNALVALNEYFKETHARLIELSRSGRPRSSERTAMTFAELADRLEAEPPLGAPPGLVDRTVRECRLLAVPPEPDIRRLVARGVLRRLTGNRYRLPGSLHDLPEHLAARVVGVEAGPGGPVPTFRRRRVRARGRPLRFLRCLGLCESAACLSGRRPLHIRAGRADSLGHLTTTFPVM